MDVLRHEPKVDHLRLYRCVSCGTRWLLWPEGIWNLLDGESRPLDCCDNAPMGGQIKHMRDIPLGQEGLRAQLAARDAEIRRVTEERDELKKLSIVEIDRANAADKSADALRQMIAQTRHPIVTDSMSWYGDSFICEWCNASWGTEKVRGFSQEDYLKIGRQSHPQNGCLALTLKDTE